MKNFISIVIPVKEINGFIRKETLPAILKQTYKDFEVIIVTDKFSKEKFAKTKIIPSWPKKGPADKRDLGVQKAKGDIICFLDDDSYPDKNLLKNAIKIFKEGKDITGVCGPNLTPLHNNVLQKASGYVWSTWLGSGGAGSYRCNACERRQVDDFPTVNLLVKKDDFLKVGGFDSHFWPGEDTKLCHDLVYKLGKKIIYDPNILVYHHRREVFKPHLAQIGRYAIHRGHFARILPRTSLRFGYFSPTFFALGLILGPILILLLNYFNSLILAKIVFVVYVFSISIYFFLLLITGLEIYLKEKNYKLFWLSMISIFVTHFVYGILLMKGFFSKKLER